MTEMKFVTIKKCEAELRKLRGGSPGTETDIKIAIWKRIKKHVKKGKTVTQDENDNIKLWDENLSV